MPRMITNTSPHQSLDGGAHHAGEQEERRDQDVEERQRGEGHGWGQVGVLGDMNVDHERLKGRRERESIGHLRWRRSGRSEGSHRQHRQDGDRRVHEN